MLHYGDFGIDINSVLGGALSNALISNYSTIEIRTSLSPSITLNVSDLLDTSPPSAFTKYLQPTVILTDASGQKTTIAPYGVATNGSALPGIAIIGAILGIGFLCGRLTKK